MPDKKQPKIRFASQTFIQTFNSEEGLIPHEVCRGKLKSTPSLDALTEYQACNKSTLESAYLSTDLITSEIDQSNSWMSDTFDDGSNVKLKRRQNFCNDTMQIVDIMSRGKTDLSTTVSTDFSFTNSDAFDINMDTFCIFNNNNKSLKKTSLSDTLSTVCDAEMNNVSIMVVKNAVDSTSSDITMETIVMEESVRTSNVDVHKAENSMEHESQASTCISGSFDANLLVEVGSVLSENSLSMREQYKTMIIKRLPYQRDYSKLNENDLDIYVLAWIQTRLYQFKKANNEAEYFFPLVFNSNLHFLDYINVHHQLFPFIEEHSNSLELIHNLERLDISLYETKGAQTSLAVKLLILHQKYHKKHSNFIKDDFEEKQKKMKLAEKQVLNLKRLEDKLKMKQIELCDILNN